MKKTETILFLGLISSAYQGFEVTEDRISMWSMMLQDIAFEEAQVNLKNHIKHNRFAPTIADILNPPQPSRFDLEIESREREMAYNKALREWPGDIETTFPFEGFSKAYDRGTHEEFMRERLQLFRLPEVQRIVGYLPSTLPH